MWSISWCRRPPCMRNTEKKSKITKRRRRKWEHTTRSCSKIFNLKVWVGHRSWTHIFPKPWNLWQHEDNFIPVLSLQEAHLKRTHNRWLKNHFQYLITVSVVKNSFFFRFWQNNKVGVDHYMKRASLQSWQEENMESEKKQMSLAICKEECAKQRRDHDCFHFVHSCDATVSVSMQHGVHKYIFGYYVKHLTKCKAICMTATI